jgi:hypothetical protein
MAATSPRLPLRSKAATLINPRSWIGPVTSLLAAVGSLPSLV